MVGFLSAFMLERIHDPWYGALDMMGNGVTPMLKLDGLVRVRHWLDAPDRVRCHGRLLGVRMVKHSRASEGLLT